VQPAGKHLVKGNSIEEDGNATVDIHELPE
jgi:hypothetical protein